MHRITRLSLFVVLLCVALTAGSCKWFRGNSNKNNTNSSTPKLARWVAQYRSPLSQGLTGNDLAENFYYSSIAVLTPSLVYVGGDMRNPKNREDRVGVIVKTTDGGQTWSETILEQASVVDIRINGMAFANAETGYAVGRVQGNEGIVFKTTDGGATWSFSRLAGIKQTPTTIFMADAETGWMGGATSIDPDDEEDGDPGGPSDLLATTDGGKTWQSQVRMPVSIYDIQFLDKMTGWASGSKGAIYHTTNGGLTWGKQRSEIEAGDVFTLPGTEGAKMFAISGISFADANTGYAAARAADEDTGRVLGTSNGGEVWAKQRIVADSGARDLVFLNPSEGWILTDKGSYIYHTVDSNKTWLSEKKDLEYDPPLSRLGAADAQHVWAVGGGVIFVRQSD
jgi:photosystem II stability/assembly factor-like uncharacterized protein